MYVGNRYTVSLSGSRWRPVHCSHCRCDWAYRVTRQATGNGRSPYFLDNAGANQRARASAARNLERALEAAFEEVPCPRCGRYQEEMVARLRARQHPELAVLGGLVLAAALGVLAVGATVALMPTLALVGLLIAGASAAFLGRALLQARYDPNADAFTRSRREMGRNGKLILREHYEEVVAAAAAQGLAGKLQQIDWARAA